MQTLTVADVLDRARDLHGLKSDYALCKALNCSTQLVANWRHGRTLPDEKSCHALAVLAQVDPFVFIAQMNAQRAKTTEARSIWEAMAERLQMAATGLAAAIFAVAVAMGIGADEAYAEAIPAQMVSVLSGSTGYTSCLAGWFLIWVIFLTLAARVDRGFSPTFAPLP